ncbi:MAG: zinc ribbon domain-containing protein [Gemmatimonadaceae bacterium]
METGKMQSEVEALLALQEDDTRIKELEARLHALDPRMAALDRKRENAQTAVSRSAAAVEAEERRQRELQGKIAQHKQMQEKNLAQLDAVKRLKEATAAMAQVESARRIIAEDESELQALNRRIGEMRTAVISSETTLAAVEEEQAAAREEISKERSEIEESLTGARAERNSKTGNVPRQLLGKYDRIRTRRTQALYPLRGESCGNCDTAIPMQRRNHMAVDGPIDVCEACGVLLYRAAGA